MMPTSLTIDFNQPLPLFPLPGCVLLPHATIPLHLFEPRYVAMVTDALAGERLICTAMFHGQGWKEEYENTPPVRPYVCVGYIVQHLQLPDGRYNILLQGLCRAKIRSEVLQPGQLYRTAYLEPTDTQIPLELDLAINRQNIDQLLCDPLLTQLASVSAINRWISDEVHTSTVVDLGTMTLCEESETRYSMLQEPDAFVRANRFTRILKDTRRTMHMAQRLAPKDLTDHMNLN